MSQLAEQEQNSFEIRTLGSRNVNMSNALVRAAQGLLLAEKRVLSCAIAKLDSMRMPDASKPVVAKITAAEFAETFGLDPNTAYDELQASAEKLMDRRIRYEKEGRKGPQIVEMRWVGRASYAKGDGYVEIAFWHEVLPHLVALREQFTSYKLSQAAALRSMFSWRLLELFSQFRSTGLLRINIDEFAHAMNAKESCRKNFKDMRRRVIEPAVKELTEKDNYTIEWTAKKEGRKVTGLEFQFRESDQSALF